MHRNLLLPVGSKMEESLVNQSPMKQKSTRYVNIQPTEKLAEISSDSQEILLVSGSPKVIPKKEMIHIN